MSIAASDYNIKYMTVGIALSFMSLISVFPALSGVLNGYSISSLLIVNFTTLYSVMMFATSYVEEEQHFWYWSLSGWILYLYFSRSVLLATVRCPLSVNVNIQSSSRTKSTSHKPHKIDILYITILSLHRICQRWNQTGQKFAGADDISNSFLSKQPLLLWALVVATYSRIIWHIRGASYRFLTAVFAVCTIGIAFKISFTMQDAPELLPSSISRVTPFLTHFSLLFQARCVFIGLLAILVLYFYDKKSENLTVSSSGMWRHSVSVSIYLYPVNVDIQLLLSYLGPFSSSLKVAQRIFRYSYYLICKRKFWVRCRLALCVTVLNYNRNSKSKFRSVGIVLPTAQPCFFLCTGE